jgi:hypothetical protein
VDNFSYFAIRGSWAGTYSLRFEVGIGGIREHLWIAAMTFLFPGILFGLASALDIGTYLFGWSGIPFLMSVVLLNLAVWTVIALSIRRWKVPATQLGFFSTTMI